LVGADAADPVVGDGAAAALGALLPVSAAGADAFSEVPPEGATEALAEEEDEELVPPSSFTPLR